MGLNLVRLHSVFSLFSVAGVGSLLCAVCLGAFPELREMWEVKWLYETVV